MSHWRKGEMIKKPGRKKKGETFIFYEDRDFGSWRALYNYLPFPKVQYDVFLKRIKEGKDPREACATGFKDREKKRVRIKIKKEPGYINMRLSKKEALVYDKEYKKEIQKLEDILMHSEEQDRSIEKRLKGLKEEYAVFIKANPL